MLPNDPSDPTGQDSRESQASAALRGRVTRCVKQYRDVLAKIDFVKVQTNAEWSTNATTYEFRTLPTVLAMYLAQAGAKVDEILLEGGTQNIWFAAQYVEAAYQTGAARNRANLAAQSAVYKAARPDLRALLLSEPYQRRMSMLYAREFEEMAGLAAEVKRDMAQILTAGMANGQGPMEISKQMTQQLGIEKRRADRIARTEINAAHTNARMDQALDAQLTLDLDSREMHVSALSPTTRQSHRDRHGTLHSVQDQRDWWSRDGNRINCYLPGTQVRGEFCAGSKGHYRGPVVKVVTASGRNLTVTPNHPVMTADGLVAAHEIREGDYLLAYPIQGEDAAGVGTLNDEYRDSHIEQVFGSLLEVGHSVRLRVAAVDFHGDGAQFEEHIDVVRSERFLASSADAELRESLDSLKLEHTYSVLSHSGSSLDAYLRAVDLPAPCLMSGGSDGAPVFGSSSAHADSSSLTHRSPGHPLLPENSSNNAAGDAKDGGDTLFGYAGKVFADHVTGVEVFEWCGHVYDLEEKSGLMVANGIIASNCKCSTVTVLVDKRGQPLSPGIVQAAKAQKSKQ